MIPIVLDDPPEYYRIILEMANRYGRVFDIRDEFQKAMINSVTIGSYTRNLPAFPTSLEVSIYGVYLRLIWKLIVHDLPFTLYTTSYNYTIVYNPT